MKIGIIGGGVWGSAIAKLLSNNKVRIITRDTKIVSSINEHRFNPRLKYAVFNENVSATDDLNEAKDMDYLFLTLPSQKIRDVLSKVNLSKQNQEIIIASKGIEVESFSFLSDVVQEVTKNKNINILSGPCFSEEVSQNLPTAVTFASSSKKSFENKNTLFYNKNFRIYYSNDLIGVEVCAATKNIYSMLIGASEGLSSNSLDNEIKKKYYLNTSASLAYKSVSEMKILTKKLNGKAETAYGLSGLGDLYVSSAGGRNSKMGYYLGQGHSFKEAKEKFMKDITVEGADLAFEIGPKILKEFDKKEFPLLISVIESIYNNKKLEISW